MSETYHKPVLLEEILENLQVKKGGKYIDCTLGDGGHTIEILRVGGKVLGIDAEEGSLKRAKERIKNEGLEENFTGVLGNFKDIENLAKENDFSEVDGILYDLGYSSSQLEDEEIGLSFGKDQPLDMRVDKSLGVTAEDLINALSEKELEKLLREFGEERNARRIAKKIVEVRKLERIATTKRLAEVIVEASPGYEHRLHPATRTFQGLRIAVNDELENLETTLPKAARLLLPGGRMAVISFHSLEDRVAKHYGLRAQPDLKVLTSKPLLPSEDEVRENPRARSAKLRVFEKTK